MVSIASIVGSICSGVPEAVDVGEESRVGGGRDGGGGGLEGQHHCLESVRPRDFLKTIRNGMSPTAL